MKAALANTARAIVMRENGTPEVLRLAEVAIVEPGPGEILLRQLAAGVNYHDVYVRSGLHQTLALPGIPGAEAVGIVEALGADVEGVEVGDYVGYVSRIYGGYATRRVLPADLIIRLPEWLAPIDAAALMLKGMTAQLLLHGVYRLRRGDTILVHAAAGALGQMLVQWAASSGVHVIGTAGSAEKLERSYGAGCEHVIPYREQNFVAEVERLTNGRGVNAVFDGVGQDTIPGSLECVGMKGMLVSYGQASGPVPLISVANLAKKSVTLTRPAIFHFIVNRTERQEMMDSVFEALRGGKISMDNVSVVPLAQAAEAHRRLESRSTIGPIVLDMSDV